MIETPSIQWFPGHMAKTRRIMRDSMRFVDVVVELIDARIPISSRNPEIDRMIGRKPRIVLLNKSDAADDRITKQWCSYFQEKGIPVLAADCRSGKGLGGFLSLLKRTLKDEIKRRKMKGMEGQPIRMMIVGIPNVGKSSFINRMAKSKRAKVEDRPGVTRGKQWVTLDKGLELLDMPGVLWPKFENKTVGEHLAFTGAVRDDILDTELLAMRLVLQLKERYGQLLADRYKLTEEDLDTDDAYELLQRIGKRRGMLIPGGEVDTERAAIIVLDEFRAGKIGRVTLETPDDIERFEADANE